MVKNRIFNKLIPATLCLILMGRQAAFLPSYAQSQVSHFASSGTVSPHCHMHIEGTIPHFHQNVGQLQASTAIRVNNPIPRAITTTFTSSVTTTAPAPRVWSGMPASITGSFASVNHIGAISTVHRAFFMHHQMNTGGQNPFSHHHQIQDSTSTVASQGVNVIRPIAIGGYHAGYIKQHIDNQLANTVNFSHFTRQTNPNNIQSTWQRSGYMHGYAFVNGKFQLQPINLDLSSTSANVSAGRILRNDPVSINVGGISMLVTSSSLLTAAEKVAVYQIIKTGSQSLLLDAQGSADGGSLVIGSHLSHMLGSLTIPQGVTVDSKTGTLKLSGNLIDNGSLYLLSNSSGNTGITASNIIVQSQGLIASILPSGSILGTMSLNAQNSIVNAGTILNAGNVNLSVGSGNITNSGLVASSQGNINISSPVSTNSIIVNGTGGTFSALQGAINIRDAAYTGNGNIALNGGDWLSKEVNLNSGTGVVTANIGNVTGPINTNAGAAYVLASTEDLIIGNTNISGDPSYFNTAGAITIAGNLSFSGQDLAIVAATNILTASGAGSISTSSVSGNGGNITMIAGANFTSSGSASGSNDKTTTLTINGGSASGGSINLSGVAPILSFSSESSHLGSNGGNINLIAYGGSGSSAGTITLPSTLAIASGGLGSGANGNVNIIAGASTGTSINVGKIIATGGTGGGGNVVLATQTPTISGAANMKILNGSIINGATFVGGSNQNGSISTGAISTAIGSSTTINAGNSVSINGNINTGALSITSGSTGSITIPSGISAVSITTNVTTANLILNGSLGGTTGGVNITGDGTNLAITFGNGASITSTSGAVNINGWGSGIGITITSPSGGLASIGTSGGAININPTAGSFVTFANSGAGATTLILNSGGAAGSGGAININNSTINSSVSVNVNSNVTLSANNTFNITADTVNNNGVIKNTTPSLLYSIVLTGTPSITLNGNGIYNIAGGGSGDRIYIDSQFAGNVTINNSPTFSASNAATGGWLLVRPSNTTTINANSTLNLSNMALFIQGPVLTFGANSAILGKNSGIEIDNFFGSSLTINLPGNSSATLQASMPGTNGAITIETGAFGVTTSQPLFFVSSGGPSTLYLNNQTTINSTGDVNVGSGVTLSGQLTSINSNVGNGGNIIVNGNIFSTVALTATTSKTGLLSVASGSTISAPTTTIVTPTLINNGVITATQGNLTIQSNASNFALTVNFGPNVGGTLSQLSANNTGASVNFNTVNAGAITITGGPSYGLISANTNVVMNGGLGAVNTNNNQIIGCIHVNGSSISMTTAVGDLDFCLGINTSSGSGSGGSITLAANGGSVNSGAITSNGSGTGNSAGGINISAADGINVGAINANGVNGASGGRIVLSTRGAISGTFISATGSGAGNGGVIKTSSSTLLLTGVNSAGNSIDVSALGTGIGGFMRVQTDASEPFVVGSVGTGTNGTAGNVRGDGGAGGGFLIFANRGNGVNQVINGQISANSQNSGGPSDFFGKIEFEGVPFGSGPLTVVFNGGFVEARNTTDTQGRVGFNGGPGQDVNILGFGAVHGSDFVSAGNLNRFTLVPLDVPAGTITVSPTVTITNRFLTNGVIPLPVSPAPSLLPLLPGGIFGTTPTTIASVPLLPSTDYTPFGHFLYQYYRQDPRFAQPRFQLGIAYKRKTTAYIPGTKSYGHIFTGNETNRLLSYGMKLNNSDVSNELNIDKGNILFAPDKNIIVGTHEGNIYMSPGSAAFVMESGSDVVVYNLLQRLTKQVSVLVNNHKIFLAPGQMMVLTRQNVDDFENINADCHMISYRGAREVPMSEKGIKAFVAEYSIASAFLAVEPLQQLIASSDRQDKTILNKIVKSAVMLGDFTGTIDMEQLANLDRQSNANDDRMANTDEIILDSAKTMVTAKDRPYQ